MRKAAKGMEINSVICKESTVEGTYKTSGSARIDGNIVGDIFSERTIIIGEKGKVTGNVYAVDIVVAGEVNGELHASKKVEVASTGNVTGNIHTPSIVIDEKAIFQGKCHMEKPIEMSSEKSSEISKEKASEKSNEKLELNINAK